MTEKIDKTNMAIEEENRFAAIILDRLADGLAIMDMELCILQFNKVAVNMWGYPKDEVIGQSCSNFISEEDITTIHTVLQELIAQKETMRKLNITGIKKSGERFPINANVSLLMDNQGRPEKVIALLRDDTERKWTEDGIKNSQQLLQGIINLLPIRIFWKDKNLKFVGCNEIFAKDAGKNRTEDLIGKDDFQMNWKEQAESYRKDDQSVIESGKSKLDIEELQTTPNGDKIWLKTSKVPLIDLHGNTIGILGTYEDITERKLAEKTLHSSEERFRTIFKQAPLGIALVDSITGHILEVNQMFTKITGRTEEQTTSIDWMAITHPDDLQEDLDNMAMLNAGKINGFQMKKRYLKPDGTIVWINMTITPVNFDNKKSPRHLCMIEDITERKRMEEAMESRMVALTRPLDDVSSITFEDLFNVSDIQRLQDEFSTATGVASLITRVDGTPITVPSNFCRLCKIIRKTEKGQANCLKSDTLIGRYHASGPVLQPCLSGGLWDAGASIHVGGRHIASWLVGQVRDENQTEEKMREYARKIGADEQAVVEAFREVPAMSRERFNQITQALFTLANQLSTMAYQNIQQARFIAERKQAEEEMKSLNEKLKDANREMKSFLFVASHDLREPLRKVSTFAFLLEKSLGGKISKDDSENLRFVMDGSNKMTKMIESLLAYSTVITKELPFKTVKLDDLINKLKTTELADIITASGAIIDIPKSLPQIKADFLLISQVLHNLIADGIKYQKEGNVPHIIITSKPAAGGMVKIEITDNGIGIAPEYHQAIFTMFKRLHLGSEYDGIGIGLTMCKKIVERHGGQIGVESQPGKGSTFWFTVPAIKAAHHSAKSLIEKA